MSQPQSGTAENRAWAPTGREQEVDCNLCGSADRCLVAEENQYNVVRCEECGLLYVSPQPTDEDLSEFYAQYFPEESGDIWGEMMRRNFDLDSEYLLRKTGARGKALDIGCGHGEFLRRFAERGWDAFGLDFSPEAAAAANEIEGVQASQGEFAAGLFEAESFDVVTAWYVLEHARAPRTFVEEAFRILKPGGMFGIRVPNMVFSKVFLAMKKIPNMDKLLFAMNIDTDNKSSHFNIIDPPAHLFGFTPKTIEKLLSDVGFGNIAIIPSQPVEVGTTGTLIAKKVLFGSTSLVSLVTGHRFNPAPAVTAYARKI
ncbi:MAG: class I SAM-dependent methyltransferase [Gammaproteobacteria bacterium]|jgi:SAM-dependent methyltransferase|nr:class I SAM-dependent methyltransferase [Gammaproteobacteria bacterium]MDP6617235.1 class I SAM-dependent methyltransferase [Gammaproteobacteria bacterium]MDP6695822.1 class I SAM-dependent methyltransferase [Gammaproteobacteria bacterium]